MIGRQYVLTFMLTAHKAACSCDTLRRSRTDKFTLEQSVLLVRRLTSDRGLPCTITTLPLGPARGTDGKCF